MLQEFILRAKTRTPSVNWIINSNRNEYMVGRPGWDKRIHLMLSKLINRAAFLYSCRWCLQLSQGVEVIDVD